jgi:hypothetical protein
MMKEQDRRPAGQRKRVRLHAARRFLRPDCHPADRFVVELFSDLQWFRKHPDDPDFPAPMMTAKAFEYLITYLTRLEYPDWYCKAGGRDE